MAQPKPQSKLVYRIKRIMKDIALDSLFPRLYEKAVRECPEPHRVVFLETKESVMPQAMRHIWERILSETSYEVEFITLRQNNSSIPRYYVNCRDVVPKLAQASHIFLCDASDLVSAMPLRPETKVVQLWHGAGAFKKWGMSTADSKFGESRADQLRHPFYGNLDLVCVSSPEVVWAYEEAMALGAAQGSPDVVQPVGVAATDVFFDDAFLENARRTVESVVPESRGKKIVLYMPTFRGRVRFAEGPDELDIAAMQHALADEWVFLARHHPYVKNPPAIPDACASFAFDVSGQERLGPEVLLASADALITDYSSIVFDYSLLGRPACFFAFDRDSYVDWRGFYYEYEDMVPGPVFTSSDQVLDWLSHVDERFEGAHVEAFRQRFMASCDGHSVDRIFDFAFGDEWRRRRRPAAKDVLAEAGVGDIDISIVIPAHNAECTIGRALERVAAQTYDHTRMECIVVDDGSDDSTADVVREYVNQESTLFRLVCSETCSGSPAAPRNIGLGEARGTYVFFHDADDYLEPDAVERMLNNAVNWGSDVLLVKMFDDDNRGLPQSMFGYSQPTADKYRSKVMWSFAPIKLFRRSLVQDLRFPDDMPEDILFVLQAYVGAKVVSVAADGDYYHATLGGGAHESELTWDDIDSNLRAYADIFAFIDANVPDGDRDPVLMRRLFWRDIYRTFLAIADEERTDPVAAKAHHDALVRLAKPYWREGMYATCPEDVRAVLVNAFA